MAILDVQDLTKRFGGLTAVNSVSFSVEEGAILSVIGPNGAGKSTLFKLICSFVTPTSGRVNFNGQTITGLPPHEVARRGVVRTFQETTIFKEMTALQNVMSGPLYALGQKREVAEAAAKKLLDRVGLADKVNAKPGNLSGGQQQRVAIARALAVNPSAMLFDEPTSAIPVP